MEDKFAPTPGELFRADFRKLGDMLAKPEFSLQFAQQLSGDFPELIEAFSGKVANAVETQPPDIGVLRLAEKMGVLRYPVLQLFRAAAEGKLDAAKWLAARLDSAAVEKEGMDHANLQGLVIIFRGVFLPKTVKSNMLNTAVGITTEIFLQLDELHYGITSYEDIDARGYPLVRTYLQFTEHRRRPGKQSANPEFLAHTEHKLEAAAWILNTFASAYPDAKIYEEFDYEVHPNDSAVVREMVKTFRQTRKK